MSATSKPSPIPARRPLADALWAAYGHLRHGRSREHAGRAIAVARQAGWTGDEETLWRAAKVMADCPGSLAWAAQTGFLSGEIAPIRQ